MNQLQRVGVIGCGLMGSGITETCARAGLDVSVAVSTDQSAARGRRRLANSLDRAVLTGKIGRDDRDKLLDRIVLTTDLGQLSDRQLVIEAVTEDEPVKVGLFAELDRIVRDPAAILASTTSSIPIVRLAKATTRPGDVVGVHFFNPAPVMPLVELVGSLLTGEQTYQRMSDFLTGVLGKQVVRAPDRAGFIVNALLVPYLLSAVRMLEAGVATKDEIDKAMELGCSHPMGPLKLIDLIGLDVVASVAESLYQEFREISYSPPTMLRRMVDAGLLGHKSGAGFYPG
ncbi:3-hydroxybutyryl-CoA dehydrogenase [Amycolatopsis nigrescens]|uniref:3-hydroxybutyryl-CoA dehydrogenase n=1 Tax=Amycolatopsis nigrescens TaxID=381445 RepID=UPI000368A0D2|nr:3-hydroxybutyryl-CoA dehydrogenase [Amycolatopsis nigrescens]